MNKPITVLMVASALLVGCGDETVVKTAMIQTPTSSKIVCYNKSDKELSDEICQEYIKKQQAPSNVQVSQNTSANVPEQPVEQSQQQPMQAPVAQQEVQYSQPQTVVQQVPVQQPVIVQQHDSTGALITGMALGHMMSNSGGYNNGYTGDRNVTRNTTVINKTYNNTTVNKPVSQPRYATPVNTMIKPTNTYKPFTNSYSKSQQRSSVFSSSSSSRRSPFVKHK